MKQPNFTPGPWEVRENKVPGYERVISVCAQGDLGVCRLDGGGSRNPKVLNGVRANARLIAAAPALYADLTVLRPFVAAQDVPTIDAALALATGENQ